MKSINRLGCNHTSQIGNVQRANIANSKSLLSLGVIVLIAFASLGLSIQAKAGPAVEKPKPFDFAFLGDTAYVLETQPTFDQIINQINSDSSILFSIHIGDFHGGTILAESGVGEPCNSTVFNRAFNQLNQFERALVFTPGDNEWSDCSDSSITALERVDPLVALANLRSLFYSGANNEGAGLSLGQNPIVVERQSDGGDRSATSFDESKFVENQMWRHRDILFVTPHIVGGSGIDNCIIINANGERIGTVDNIPTSCSSENQERQAANIAWINKAFEKAKKDKVLGVVIAFQANLFYNLANNDGTCKSGLTLADQRLCKVFEPYRIAIGNATRTLGKPVAALYGDSHRFQVERPLSDVPNFLLVQTVGNPDTGWVRIRVDATNPQLFSASLGGCSAAPGGIFANPVCDPLKEQKSNVIATSTVAIPGSDSCGNSQGRTCESLVGNVVADAMRLQNGTDFALHNSGGIRTALTCPLNDNINDYCNPYASPPPPFHITEGQAIPVVPFSTNLVQTFNMSGAELKAWMENGVSIMPNAAGRYPQVSGLCFTYDIAQPVGSRVTSMVKQAADGTCTGAAVDMAGTTLDYSMATINFIAGGGDGYLAIPSARRLTFGLVVVDVVDYLKASVSISPTIQGRSRCTTTGATACPVQLP